MSIQPPPIYEKLSGSDGKSTLPWILFFDQIFNGDSGIDWTPTFTNLTEVGGATIEGRYYRLSQYITFFRVKITPSTSTTSTAASTYIDNFPLTFSSDGFCVAVRGGEGSNAGHIVSSTNRIYTPAWTAVTVPLYVLGIGEAR